MEHRLNAFYKELRLISEMRMAQLAEIPRNLVTSTTKGNELNESLYEQVSSAEVKTGDVYVKFSFYFNPDTLVETIHLHNKTFSKETLMFFPSEFVNILMGIVNGVLNSKAPPPRPSIPKTKKSSEEDEQKEEVLSEIDHHWIIAIGATYFHCKIDIKYKNPISISSLHQLPDIDQVMVMGEFLQEDQPQEEEQAIVHRPKLRIVK